MRVNIYLAAWLVALWASTTPRVLAERAAPSATVENPGLAGLQGTERRVVEYLVDDWGKDSAVTSVDIGMDALKLRPSDETRFRIGTQGTIRQGGSRKYHRVSRRWMSAQQPLQIGRGPGSLDWTRTTPQRP